MSHEPAIPLIFGRKANHTIKKTTMGRGDKKTKKGKIFKGSFGKSRPAKTTKKSADTAAPASPAAPKGK